MPRACCGTTPGDPHTRPCEERRRASRDFPASREVVHIAGLLVVVGGRQRQRCAWCGAVLEDTVLANVAVAPPPDGVQQAAWGPGGWQPGGLVAMVGSHDAGTAWVVEHRDGDQLPASACGGLDPEVTG